MKIACAALLLCLMAGIAWGQWDESVLLTDDEYRHRFPQLLVDSLYHVHLFDIRCLVPGPHDAPNSLYYQQFTNWGVPITEAIELLPGGGQDRQDYQPGMILDSEGNIHVVWGRYEGEVPADFHMYYCRLNMSGEITTSPFAVELENDPDFYVQGGVHLAESPDGLIWITCLTHVFVVNHAGEITEPLHPIVTHWAQSSGAIPACTPNGEVWACIRYWGPPTNLQNISIVRVDIPDQLPEIASGPDSGEWIQMGPEAFGIDTAGAFHYILFRDDAGFFYQRDPRDGEPIDTTVIDPAPYGDVSTQFTRVGSDTLMYVWTRTLPQPVLLRVAFSISGDAIGGPLSVPQVMGATSDQTVQWRGGGYWVAGGDEGSIPFVWQAAMIHVPGSNEPPNATSPSEMPLRIDMISVYPNPFNESVILSFPARAMRGIALYDLLGRLVIRQDILPHQTSLFLDKRVTSGLPSGVFFVYPGGGSLKPLKVIHNK